MEIPSAIDANRPLIGAHTSTQEGLHNALLHGAAIGATTIQLFTSNQRQWLGRPLSKAILDKWYDTLEATAIRQVMSHASYLINLGSNKEALLTKSRAAFVEEVTRCLALKISYLNFHPGAATGDSIAACLDRIIASLSALEPLFQQETTLRLLMETTAGQGSTVGHSFEQLTYIIERIKGVVPIGVCIDTCHIFAAGYDIRTLDGWEDTLTQFESIVGLNHLYALHVNDSMMPFGSRKDRHANLGDGAIGMACFKAMMQHPKLRMVPKYLETPNGAAMWTKEIALLQSFY
ncbi:MAG: deoxyribonuclease IV [Candidatus Cardinium sp.]|uniref:deoxyribonuclease IV n=1 Tax=Cardinium endosymbiont of Dermatophagoides farinae TaxID=2597823 RepID=UPI00118243C6|nr:deoxyribonuclease IV [Cardinium endosymbiont of Dermatophagoides farinae]TSJ81063.1 deoxyribonuclease IV [Cardinium endosymbiont of Dermatophagoides farinae]UWW97097.1 MAG: deoxyribonuclease IV [Candidatus Cardinium sp.]